MVVYFEYNFYIIIIKNVILDWGGGYDLVINGCV